MGACGGVTGHHPRPPFTLVMLGSHLADRYRMPISCALAMAFWRVETPSFR